MKRARDDDDSGGDHEYMNVSACSLSTQVTAAALALAQVTESRSRPMLASDGRPKNLTITRAQIMGTQQLPVFECLTQNIPNVAYDASTSIYTVSVTLGASLVSPIDVGTVWPVTLAAINWPLTITALVGPGRVSGVYKVMLTPAVYANITAMAAGIQTDVRTNTPLVDFECKPVPNYGTPYVERLSFQLGVSTSATEAVISTTATVAAKLGFNSVTFKQLVSASSASITPNDPDKYTKVAPMYDWSFTSTQGVIWVPEDKEETPPPTFVTPSYYHMCYDVGHVVGIFNTALAAAAADCIAHFNSDWAIAYPLLAAPPIISEPPLITYNSGAGVFSFNLDSNGYDMSTMGVGGMRYTAGSNTYPSTGEKWSVGFNQHGWLLFSTFPTTFTPLDGYTVSLLAGTKGSLPTGRECWVVTAEDISTSQNWSPIDAIVFVSGNLPIKTEDQSVTRNLLGNSSNVASSNPNFAPIITDINLPINRATDWRQLITYTPSILRFTDMYPSTGVVALSISIFWRHKYSGSLISMEMEPNSTLSLKVGVFDKDAST